MLNPCDGGRTVSLAMILSLMTAIAASIVKDAMTPKIVATMRLS